MEHMVALQYFSKGDEKHSTIVVARGEERCKYLPIPQKVAGGSMHREP